jgi:hypothetical protein
MKQIKATCRNFMSLPERHDDTFRPGYAWNLIRYMPGMAHRTGIFGICGFNVYA